MWEGSEMESGEGEGGEGEGGEGEGGEEREVKCKSAVVQGACSPGAPCLCLSQSCFSFLQWHDCDLRSPSEACLMQF